MRTISTLNYYNLYNLNEECATGVQREGNDLQSITSDFLTDWHDKTMRKPLFRVN